MPLVHLIRHGEVENPDHVVYASLPGFRLSRRGRKQARLAGGRLADRTIALLATSPLDRARETADLIVSAGRVAPVPDQRLTEWSLADRWAGTAWEALDDHFPGELDAYLGVPHEIGFAPESLAELAERVVTSVTEHAAAGGAGDVALVSHQDPVQAARLALTGRPLSELHNGKPEHASIVTLAPGSRGSWREVEYWAPPQGPRFPPAPDSGPGSTAR